jgi:hypothetical protein
MFMMSSMWYVSVDCPIDRQFQCTGLNKNDQYYMKTCPAKVGDYFEFFAEIGEFTLQMMLMFRSARCTLNLSSGKLGTTTLGTGQSDG